MARDPHLIYFDEFTVGVVTESDSYQVTEQEIVEFAQKYDPQYFHTDPIAAKNSHFGGLIASGWHSCAIVMRLLVSNFFEGRSGIGSPGMDEIRWLRPVRPGDSLRVRVTVTDKRASNSRPERGTVFFDYDIFNQDDALAMTMKGMAMFPIDLADEQ